MWLCSTLDVLGLLHEFLVNALTAGCIDDDNIIALRLRLGNGIEGYLYRVCGTFFEMDRHVNLLCQYAQLLHSSRTERIAGSKERTLVLLLLEEECQLA